MHGYIPTYLGLWWENVGHLRFLTEGTLNCAPAVPHCRKKEEEEYNYNNNKKRSGRVERSRKALKAHYANDHLHRKTKNNKMRKMKRGGGGGGGENNTSHSVI